MMIVKDGGLGSGGSGGGGCDGWGNGRSAEGAVKVLVWWRYRWCKQKKIIEKQKLTINCCFFPKVRILNSPLPAPTHKK